MILKAGSCHQTIALKISYLKLWRNASFLQRESEIWLVSKQRKNSQKLWLNFNRNLKCISRTNWKQRESIRQSSTRRISMFLPRRGTFQLTRVPLLKLNGHQMLWQRKRDRISFQSFCLSCWEKWLAKALNLSCPSLADMTRIHIVIGIGFSYDPPNLDNTTVVWRGFSFLANGNLVEHSFNRIFLNADLFSVFFFSSSLLCVARTLHATLKSDPQIPCSTPLCLFT